MNDMELIDRIKLIQELNYLKLLDYDNSGVTKLRNLEIQRCISVVEDAPALIKCGTTPEGFPLMDLRPRPQGEWVAHEDMDEWYECNKCHRGNTYFDKLPNFCPNCGADMRGAE